MTFSKMRSLAILFAIGIALPVAASAQSARIGVYRDIPTSSPCEFNLLSGFQQFTIWMDATVAPVNRVRLKVEFSTPAAIVVFGPAGGEFDVTSGGVDPYWHNGSVIARFALLVPVGETPPCTMRIVPLPGANNIELTDSQGNPMIGAWTNDSPDCSSRASWIAPYLPVPPNGATNVPLNQLLSYRGPANVVVLGTNPVPDPNDPASIVCTSDAAPLGKPQCIVPIDPGILLPLTTYYWRAYNVCVGCEQGEGAASEIFSFTTSGGPLAVEPASWGKVKAMYRE